MGNLKPKRGREIPSEGWCVAHVAKICHIGTHEYFDDGLWEQFVVFFELDETDSSGMNFMRSRTIKISGHEKSTMTALVKATGVPCDEDGFPNARDLLGRPLYLEIVRKDKEGVVYANLKGMSRVPKGIEVPTATIKTAYFWMDADGFNKQALDKNSGQFPDWVIDQVIASPEFAEITATPKLGENPVPSGNGAPAAKSSMKPKPKTKAAKPGSQLDAFTKDDGIPF